MQRYFSSKKDNNYLYLNNDDIYHIKTVMRYNNGDCIEIVYDNKVYIASIIDINNDIKFKIIETLDSNYKKIPNVTLIIPYLKEAKMDLIFQKATEMGISSFIIVPMERSIIKIDNKKIDAKLTRWMKICREASEQSKRITIPNIKIFNYFDELKFLDGHNFTCSTQEKANNIKKVLKNVKICDKINLVIGPEGGISPKEEQYLKNIGFISVSLGDLIMRVESVPLFLMSIINYEFME